MQICPQQKVDVYSSSPAPVAMDATVKYMIGSGFQTENLRPRCHGTCCSLTPICDCKCPMLNSKSRNEGSRRKEFQWDSRVKDLNEPVVEPQAKPGLLDPSPLARQTGPDGNLAPGSPSTNLKPTGLFKMEKGGPCFQSITPGGQHHKSSCLLPHAHGR